MLYERKYLVKQNLLVSKAKNIHKINLNNLFKLEHEKNVLAM